MLVYVKTPNPLCRSCSKNKLRFVRHEGSDCFNRDYHSGDECPFYEYEKGALDNLLERASVPEPNTRTVPPRKEKRISGYFLVLLVLFSLLVFIYIFLRRG
jgi:hypothetical protein